MRKLLLLLLLLPAYAFAQQFNNLDSIQLTKTIDQLVKDTGRKYILETNRQDDDRNNFRYINPEDPDDILMITFGSRMVGENKDLEIKGVKKWGINTIYGKYLAVFPIWKKYADSNANLEQISANRSARKGGYYFSRIDYEGHWRISL
jgi:hypothetical protein